MSTIQIDRLLDTVVKLDKLVELRRGARRYEGEALELV